MARSNLIGAAVSLVLLASASQGMATTPAVEAAAGPLERETRFDIPAQPLSAALKAFANQAGLQILFPPELVEGRRSSQVQGEKKGVEALRQLLEGTNLEFESKDTTIAVKERAKQGTKTAGAAPGYSVLSPIRMAQHDGSRTANPQGEGKSAEGGQELEEVVVQGARVFFRPTVASSGTKFPLPIFDTPQSITALTADIIETFRPADRTQLTSFVAGASNVTDAPGFDDSVGTAVAMRGFYLSSDDSYKLNGFSTYGIFRPDLAVVDRVEFVKGPTAIVYGVSHYGGVMNTVTKKPQNQFAASIEGAGGTHDSHRFAGDVTGPIGGSGVNYRLIAAYERRGFEAEGEESRHATVMPALSWNLGEETRVNLTGFYHTETIHPCTQYDLTLDDSGELSFPFDADPEICRFMLPYSRSENEHKQIIADFRHELGEGRYVTGQVGWTDTSSHLRQVYIYNFLGPSTPLTNVYNLSYQNNLETYDAEFDFGQEFEAFGRTHKLLIGAEYRSLRRDTPTYQYAYLGQTDMFNPDFSFVDISDPDMQSPPDGFQRETHDRYGAFAQLLLKATDRLSVLVGARLSYVDFTYEYADLITGGIDPELGPFSVSSSDTLSHVTPNLGLVYSIIPQVNAYASYSEGFIPQVGLTRSLKVIGPETGEQVEAGLKGQFLGGALGGSINYYSIRRSGVEASDPDNSPGESFRAAGRSQKHEGLEFELQGTVIDRLNAVVTYAHQRARITADVENPDFIGKAVSNVPVDTASLYLNYEFDGGVLDGLQIGGGVSSTGAFFNREDEFRFRFPGRHVASFSLAYPATVRLSLQLTVDNVTDEDDFYQRGSNRFSNLNRQEPRRAQLYFKYRFR